MPCMTSLHKRLFVISEEDWGDGVFWGRVGLFGLNLHFYFGLLVARKKQYLNSKKHKKEENGEKKSDTPEAVPRPSAQDSTRPWRKRRRRTLQSSWYNTLVRLRNVAAVNSPFLEVWRLIPFHLRFINTHKIYSARIFASFETSRIKKTYKTRKALLLRNISTFYFSRIMWREIFGHVAVHKRLLTRPTEYNHQGIFRTKPENHSYCISSQGFQVFHWFIWF